MVKLASYMYVTTCVIYIFININKYGFKLTLVNSIVVVVQSLSHVWLFTIPWTPGFPVLHHLLEFAQTQVHWVNDAIEPSHPLSSPSPPAYYLSQHQGLSLMCLLLTSGGPNIGASVSASVFPMNSQGWFPLGFTGLISLLSKRLSRVFSSTIVWNINPLALNSHIHIWVLEKP